MVILEKQVFEVDKVVLERLLWARVLSRRNWFHTL
jgi:hypothetical protein